MAIAGCGRKVPIYFAILSAMVMLDHGLSTAVAEQLSSNKLIEAARYIDGKAVVYKGEAVTQVLRRGPNSWVAVHDGENAISAWCKTGMADQIKMTGDYRHKGDVIEVKGVFNRACPDHNGELDIHADSVSIIEQGVNVYHKVSAKKAHTAIALFILTILIAIIFRKKV